MLAFISFVASLLGVSARKRKRLSSRSARRREWRASWRNYR